MEIMKIALVFMTVFTAVYLAAVVHAAYNSPDDPAIGGTVYQAFRYESELPPVWFTPEELGIVKVIDHGVENPTWVEVVVKNSLADLHYFQPIFQYEEKFWKISSHNVDFGEPATNRREPILIGIALSLGWIFTGMLYLRRRTS